MKIKKKVVDFEKEEEFFNFLEEEKKLEVAISVNKLKKFVYMISFLKGDYNKLLKWSLDGNFFNIIDKEGNKIPFKPNKAQKIVLEEYLRYNRLIILKSRQLGISTLCCLIALFNLLFIANSRIYMVSYTAKEADKLFQDKIRDVFFNLGVDLTNEERESFLSLWNVDKLNSNSFEINFKEAEEEGTLNKARSIFRCGVTARGFTVTLLHITEIDRLENEGVDNIKELQTGTLNTVPTNGKIIIESTASKNFGILYDMWSRAVSKKKEIEDDGDTFGPRDYFPIFVGWRCDTEEIGKAKIIPKEKFKKERGIAEFIENQIKKYNLTPQEWSFYYSKYEENNFDKHKLLSEYPTIAEEAFTSPDNSLFDASVILDQKIINPIKIDGIENINDFRNLNIYSSPVLDFTYSMGIDVASGRKGDNSAISIICKNTGQEVLSFVSNKFSPQAWGKIAYSLARLYNSAYIVPEINYEGESFLRYFNDNDYENIYNRVVYDREIGENKIIQGFWTTTQTKISILDNLIYKIHNRDIHLHGEYTIKEFLNCPKSFKSKLASEKEVKSGAFKHFDLVMATALAVEGLQNCPGSRIYVEALDKKRVMIEDPTIISLDF